MAPEDSTLSLDWAAMVTARSAVVAADEGVAARAPNTSAVNTDIIGFM
jgi:hypothetical protein